MIQKGGKVGSRREVDLLLHVPYKDDLFFFDSPPSPQPSFRNGSIGGHTTVSSPFAFICFFFRGGALQTEVYKHSHILFSSPPMIQKICDLIGKIHLQNHPLRPYKTAIFSVAN